MNPEENHREYAPREDQIDAANALIDAIDALKECLLISAQMVARKHHAYPTEDDFRRFSAALDDAVNDLFYADVSRAHKLIDAYDDGYAAEVAFQFNTSRGCI